MARLYTTEEAYKKLDISQATFYRWVTEAKQEGLGEKIEAQPSIDGRERLYGVTQLRWLATRHGKELLPDEDIYVHEPQMEVEALRRDVTNLQQRLQEMEQELIATKAQVQEAYSFCTEQVGLALVELERVRLAYAGGGSDASKIALRHANAIRRVSDVQHSSTVSVPVITDTREMKRPHRVPDDLPLGTVSMRSFAETHGSTRDTLTSAIRREELAAISRPYGGDPSRIQYFLTPEQQDQAVAYLEDHDLPFRRCRACPHSTTPQPE